MRELLLNEEIHSRVIVDLVAETRSFLWIVTADIKDMHVARGKRSVPFLSVLADLVESGIAERLISAGVLDHERCALIEQMVEKV